MFKFFLNSISNNKSISNKFQFNKINYLFFSNDNKNNTDKRIKLSDLFNEKKPIGPIQNKSNNPPENFGRKTVVQNNNQINNINEPGFLKKMKLPEEENMKKLNNSSLDNSEINKNNSKENKNSTKTISKDLSKILNLSPKNHDKTDNYSKKNENLGFNNLFENKKPLQPLKATAFKETTFKRYINYTPELKTEIKSDFSEDEIDNKISKNIVDSKNVMKDKDDEEILRYMCLPLNLQKLEDAKYKWQQFFISSTRVIPDINRAINNKPDIVYYEYIKDLIDEFTDKQLLFALKNILLNEDIIRPYEFNFIFKDLFFRLKSHGTFNMSSKLNIIILYEVFFLFDLLEYKFKHDDISVNSTSSLILQMINMIVDYQRFFFSEFNIEENILILKTMMDKNIIDVYLVKRFLEQYSELDIIETVKECKYKIKYFKTEYDLNLSIFFILDNYVKISKINFEFENFSDKNFQFLIKKLILEVINLLNFIK